MRPVRRLWSALVVLVLAPAFAASAGSDAFLVKPYLQWGDAPVAKGFRVLWHADDVDTDWSLEYRDGSAGDWRRAERLESSRIAVVGVAPHRVVKARVEGLTPGGTFSYRVKKEGDVVFEAEGRAARTADQPYRFAVYGDVGANTPEERAIAFQAYQAKPDFVFITGDIIYDRGRVSEYRTNFWPMYNADEPSPGGGVPFLRSTLFLAAPGNHDIGSRDLERYPDGLAYFFTWDLPRNDPVGKDGGAFVPPLKGPQVNQDAFRQAAGAAYPRMANFSLDYGNAHWTVLDGNPYVDWTDKELRTWVAADLAKAKGETWRFVGFHHPGFNSAVKHFTEQQMRLVADLLEAGGVDVVFNGHVHNYQRSYPLKFATEAGADGKPVRDKLLVPGKWTLDRAFDGEKDTTPEGVIYIITGGGGQHLYNPEQQDKPETWQPFTHKFISKVHSFTVVDVDGPKATIRQVDADGKELDRFVVTKPD